MAVRIMLRDVRISFPVLWEPRGFNDSEENKRYSATFIFPPDSPAIAEIKKAMMEVAKERWKEKAGAIAKSLKAQNKIPVHSGDEKGEVDGFAGMYYINTSSVTKPLVVDERRNELRPDSGKPYGGCYVNAAIEIWAQDNKYGKRINASLRGVQFVRDGDAFSGISAASRDEFDDVPVAAASDDFVADYESAEKAAGEAGEDDDLPEFI